VLRRDALGNAIFNLALAALWFHPLYWWLRGQASFAREMVADDWAAAFDGKEAYVAELVRLARSRLGGGLRKREGFAGVGPAGAIGIFGRGSDFFRRMRMLLQNDGRLAVRCSGIWRLGMGAVVAGAVAAGATFVGVRPVKADDEPAKSVTQALAPTTGAPAPEEQPDQPARAKNKPQSVSVKIESAFDADDDKDDRDDADDIADRDLRHELRSLQKQSDELAKQVAKLEAELAKQKGNKGDGDDRVKELHDRRADMLMKRSELEQVIANLRATAQATAAAQKQQDYKAAVDAAARAAAAAKRSTTVKPVAPGEKRAGASAPGTDTSVAPAYGRQPNPFDPTTGAPTPAPYPGGKFAPWQAGNPAAAQPAQPQTEPGAPEKPVRGGGYGGFAGNFGRGFGGQNPQPAYGGEGGAGGVHLDLVNLANSVADAGGAVRIAEAQLKAAARANKGGDAEIATAEAALESAHKRQQLLGGIARLALEGASRDVQRIEKLAGQGLISQDQLEERRSKVQMLKLIVESSEDGGGGGGRDRLRTDTAKPAR
jgi:hypothetical protein